MNVDFMVLLSNSIQGTSQSVRWGRGDQSPQQTQHDMVLSQYNAGCRAHIAACYHMLSDIQLFAINMEHL